ncbi:hypothetical protein BB560_000469 [Smittium megazygosporum]|uniref:Cation efflux protein transmembrane domain-containing protein n=1 Tax=Smittium megazygosporum TaxID=133381 RepID=A0A2T9ZKC8_9FUNG|nr:hypothetical protein BB560_000469 [Smittium megazygosporum]
MDERTALLNYRLTDVSNIPKLDKNDVFPNKKAPTTSFFNYNSAGMSGFQVPPIVSEPIPQIQRSRMSTLSHIFNKSNNMGIGYPPPSRAEGSIFSSSFPHSYNLKRTKTLASTYLKTEGLGSQYTKVRKSIVKNKSEHLEELRKEKNEDLKELFKHIRASTEEIKIVEDFKSGLLSIIKKSRKNKDDLVKKLVSISILINVMIAGTQMYAAFTSNSLSLFATMCDSFMDFLSSGLLLLAGWVADNPNNIGLDISGKSKVETLAIMIFSTVMGVFSSFLIFNSIESLIGEESLSNISLSSALCILFVITCKISFYFVCRNYKDNMSARVLMIDSRNDFFVNSFGLMTALSGRYLKWWIDPLGCLCAAIIILRQWILEAVGMVSTIFKFFFFYLGLLEQKKKARMIVGVCADPEMIQLLTFAAITHDPRITHIDDVRAYYSGTKMMVEVTLVMDPRTPLIISQFVSSSLEEKLEKIPDVQRAIVYIVYKVYGYGSLGSEYDIDIVIN